MTPACPHPADAPAVGCRVCRLRAVARAVGQAPPASGPAALDPPCPRRLEATGELSACAEGCGPKTKLKLFGCEVRGTCTLTRASESGAQVCARCPERPQAQRPAVRWISTAQMVADAVRLAGMLPHDLAGVIGLPRSGMMPAAAIATNRHVPLYAMTRSGPERSDWQTSRGSKPGPGVYALVDDTVYSGHAMKRAREVLTKAGWRFTTAAVYVTPWQAGTIDHFAAELPPPHLLEYNLANCGVSVGLWDQGDPRNAAFAGGVAWDLDGVICEEPAVPDAPEEAYRKWLAEARPKLVPRNSFKRRDYNCKLIVTGRRERHRAETMDWLTRHGVRVERLVMLQAERWDFAAVTEMKAREFRSSTAGIFVESCPKQAAAIFAAAGKPVICPTTGQVFQ